MRVLNEARKRYVFELRGLRFCGPWVSFYIKPADGLQLPEMIHKFPFSAIFFRPGNIPILQRLENRVKCFRRFFHAFF
jgi:hypothetical protein